MKALVDGLSLFETRLLYDIPGVLEDDLFIDALRAWKTEIPKKTLWTRLQLLLRLEQRSVMSENIYFTLKGTLYLKIVEARRAIGHVKKYSGYVRNSSSVGSKRASGQTVLEPESFEWTTNVEKDFFLFLTVGESSGLPGGVFSLKRPQKGRNGDLILK